MKEEFSSQPLTRDDCLAYLHDSIFKLESAHCNTECGKDWVGAVGLEVEMLPVRPKRIRDGKPSLISLEQGDENLFSHLRKIAKKRAWDLEEYEDKKKVPHVSRILLHENDNLSFEPGGQFEFSSKPYPCLSSAVERMRHVQKTLDESLASEGVELLQIGINPWQTVDEVGLQMTKARYHAMDEYFRRIGEYGPRMMRQTCTVQVNLDYGSNETTLAKRYLAACLMAPYAAAAFSYSGVVDNKRAGMPGFRSKVWRNVDRTRTGVPELSEVAQKLNKSSCVETVFNYLMASNVVFVEALDCKVPAETTTFGDWISTPIEGVVPTMKDLLLQLSLLFPEVRPRGFLELRSIDCQARIWQTVPASFYCGLLYDDVALDGVLDLLVGRVGRINELLDNACLGMQDEDNAKTAARLMELSKEGLGRLPECFKVDGCDMLFTRYIEHFTAKGRSPADDLLDEMKSSDVLTLESLRKLEDSWTVVAEG